jgi:hypothetical protein
MHRLGERLQRTLIESRALRSRFGSRPAKGCQQLTEKLPKST